MILYDTNNINTLYKHNFINISIYVYFYVPATQRSNMHFKSSWEFYFFEDNIQTNFNEFINIPGFFLQFEYYLLSLLDNVLNKQKSVFLVKPPKNIDDSSTFITLTLINILGYFEIFLEYFHDFE